MLQKIKLVFDLIGLALILAPTFVPKDQISVGKVKEEVRKGETLRYISLMSQKTIASNEEDANNNTIGEQKGSNGKQSFILNLSGPIWIKLKDSYEVKIKNITPEKVNYEIKVEEFFGGINFSGLSLPSKKEEKVGELGPFDVEQYRYIPPEEEPNLRPPSNKELEKFIDFFPPKLPFFWLRLPPMKKGEEIQIEWEPLPYKLIGLKPALATVQFLGIYTKDGREVALYKVKRTTGYFRGSFRLYYDLQLKKFTEMDGTFEQGRHIAQVEGKEKEKIPQSREIKVRVRDYFLF